MREIYQIFNEIREVLETYKQRLVGNFNGSQKSTMPVGICTINTLFLSIQIKTRNLLGIRLEAIDVAMWQTSWLNYVHVFKLCWKLSLKVTDKLIWFRKFQDSLTSKLGHEYCWLIWFRLQWKLKGKEQRRNTLKLCYFKLREQGDRCSKTRFAF